MHLLKFILFIVIIFITGCNKPIQLDNEVDFTGALKITSPAFGNNENMHGKYTCKGENVNPPLDISGAPADTKSFVLIVDDPDAPMGTWVHWVVWNITSETKTINEDSAPGTQGKTDFGTNSYGGPCPPSGTHRYFFKLYALDRMLNINQNSIKSDVENTMKGHILAEARLVGLYSR